jgi:hypothetical protein
MRMMLACGIPVQHRMWGYLIGVPGTGCGMAPAPIIMSHLLSAAPTELATRRPATTAWLANVLLRND